MADLELKPDFTLDDVPVYATLITKFENGIEQRRPRRASPIYEFTLMYRNRTETDMQTILDLFNSKSGAYASFTWEHPRTAETWTVRFKEDSFKYTYKSYGLFDFQFNLIQVL